MRKIPGGEQNVQKEIEVLQRLNHPNVVKVFEIFRLEEKQKLYIGIFFKFITFVENLFSDGILRLQPSANVGQLSRKNVARISSNYFF